MTGTRDRPMAPSAADLAALGAELEGEVIVPGSRAYVSVRPPATARFRDVLPLAVARCRTPADVARAIAFARRSGLELTARSGGHCFAGRSSTGGLLIDVSPMSAVSLDDGVVTVGSGALLGQVYDALEPHGVTIAAGCGPSVGIAGLTLGGGLGILGRQHGLTCDQLVRAQVVLADGRVLDCDEHQHEDLFWALRGAGGCQFGVVTELRFRTVPAPTTTTFHLVWPLTDAAAVVEAWQSFAPAAPEELAASLLLTAGGTAERPPAAHVFGAMTGTESDTRLLLDELDAGVGSQPASRALHELPYRQAKAHLAEHGPGEELAPPDNGYSKSEFFRQKIPPSAVAALIEQLTHDPTPGQVRVLDFTPWGGAYNRVREDATAFPHRGESFLVKHDVLVDAAAPAAGSRAARAWLTRSWELLHAWGSGGAYPNFPDPELADPHRAYHGGNYERLVRVKERYDPEAIFRSDQSIGRSRSA